MQPQVKWGFHSMTGRKAQIRGVDYHIMKLYFFYGFILYIQLKQGKSDTLMSAKEMDDMPPSNTA